MEDKDMSGVLFPVENKGEWMEKVILHREEKAVSFDESDNTIHFHKTYYTITEVEETLKQAKELINANK